MRSELLLHLQNFVSLGTGRPTAVMSMTGVVNSERVAGIRQFDTNVEVYYETPKGGTSREPVPPHNLLFRLSDIGDRLGGMLNTWLARESDSTPYTSSHFGTLANPHIYLDQRFLNLAQSLPSRTIGGRLRELPCPLRNTRGILCGFWQVCQRSSVSGWQASCCFRMRLRLPTDFVHCGIVSTALPARCMARCSAGLSSPVIT